MMFRGISLGPDRTDVFFGDSSAKYSCSTDISRQTKNLNETDSSAEYNCSTL